MPFLKYSLHLCFLGDNSGKRLRRAEVHALHAEPCERSCHVGPLRPLLQKPRCGRSCHRKYTFYSWSDSSFVHLSTHGSPRKSFSTPHILYSWMLHADRLSAEEKVKTTGVPDRHCTNLLMDANLISSPSSLKCPGAQSNANRPPLQTSPLCCNKIQLTGQQRAVLHCSIPSTHTRWENRLQHLRRSFRIHFCIKWVRPLAKWCIEAVIVY